MIEKQISLYKRIPEIYRNLDAKIESTFNQLPEIYKEIYKSDEQKNQLKSYISIFEEIFTKIRRNIESLYHNLFIETCDTWVIPYIGDLLGISHLQGDPWTLRANVADTIALLRKKGTLNAIEQLTFDLTKWGVFCIELKERMLLFQNLNYIDELTLQKEILRRAFPNKEDIFINGTVPIRDPASLSLINTPFDLFSYTADLKPPVFNNIRFNIPNLAIFLWRLKTFQVYGIKPHNRPDDPKAVEGGKYYLVGFNIHPLNRSIRLFNYSNKWNPTNNEQECPESRINLDKLAQIDETPSPILTARLTEEYDTGNPKKYLKVLTYNEHKEIGLENVGLVLHLLDANNDEDIWPSIQGSKSKWVIKGEDLSEWAASLKNNEIAIDPVIGRILIKVDKKSKARKIMKNIYINYTYGAVGDVGAHPHTRNIPDEWTHYQVEQIQGGEQRLNEYLKTLNQSDEYKIIEIQDSLIYYLNLNDIVLKDRLYIRAAIEQRPIIKLSNPLRFCPIDFETFKSKIESPSNGEEPLTEEDLKDRYKGKIEELVVRLEGIYLTRSTSLDKNKPLISRVAINSIEINHCTLDPEGYKEIDGTQSNYYSSIVLNNDYGFGANTEFNDNLEKSLFSEIPNIYLENTISGSLLIDDRYNLYLKNSIIDDGKGVGAEVDNSFAISTSQDSTIHWGPPTKVEGVTIFGKTRVRSICGMGAIFVHPLEVQDILKGCLKYSYLRGKKTQMPQIEKCIHNLEVTQKLRFESENFEDPEYAHLAYSVDRRIKECGPNDNAMGAFGYLLEADKWRNLGIRFREFMPIGIRPIFIIKTKEESRK